MMHADVSNSLTRSVRILERDDGLLLEVTAGQSAALPSATRLEIRVGTSDANYVGYLDVTAVGPFGSLDGSLGSGGLAAIPMPSAADYDVAESGSGDMLIAAGSVEVSDDGARMALQAVKVLEPGMVDGTFGTSGRVVTAPEWTAYANAILPLGGEVLVGGSVCGQNGSCDFVMAAVEADGSPHSAFGGGTGLVRIDVAEGSNDYFGEIHRLPGGKILASGISNGRTVLMRFDGETGVVDPSFGTAGKVVNQESFWGPRDVQALPDGRIVVVNAAGLSFFEEDGRPASTAFVALDRTLYGIRVGIDSDDRVVLAGTSISESELGEEATLILRRYSFDGALDPSFGAGGEATLPLDIQLAGIDFLANGTIILGGNTSTEFILAALDQNGALDPTFADGGKLSVDLGTSVWARSVLVLEDGRIVLAGQRSSPPATELVILRTW